jgi:hemolysin activation/secretion protein
MICRGNIEAIRITDRTALSTEAVDPNGPLLLDKHGEPLARRSVQRLVNTLP